jgi:GTPase SAR1 family protein
VGIVDGITPSRIPQLIAHYVDHYILFDCPGQVELFTHHDGIKTIIERFAKADYRVGTFSFCMASSNNRLIRSISQLCTVHLVDAHYCTDAAKYISVLLLSLRAMLQIELPHINVLSKIDLLRSYGELGRSGHVRLVL